MLKTPTLVGQMGLTKNELCKELNQCFESIYGEWDQGNSFHICEDYYLSDDEIRNIKDYCKEWLQQVNRHNKYWSCRINYVEGGSRGGIMICCGWWETDRAYVEYSYDDESESELVSDK